MDHRVVRFGLFLFFVSAVQATFDTFFFSGNGTCPGISFGCTGPNSVCAHDAVLDKYYCCSGEDYPVCRDSATTCSGDNGDPSSSQISCSNAGSSWCCLSNAETCTQRTGQINVCHATQTNIIANVSAAALNATYSSLSSANPSATAYTFDAAQLAASASSTASTGSVSTSSTTVSPSATSAAAQQKSSSGISGGAIGGIVVGAIAGVAIVVGAVYFLLRRRRRSMAGGQVYEAVQQQQQPPEYGGNGNAYEKLVTPYETPQDPIMELDTTRETAELGGESVPPVELAGSYYEPRKPGNAAE